MTIVYTFMIGDLLHVNHLYFLMKCRKMGDKLVVGIVPDEIAMKYKRKPIIPTEERAQLIYGLKCVDRVTLHDTFNPLETIKKIKPDVVVHADDWKPMPFEKEIKALGIKVVYTPYIKGTSTSKIIKKILKNKKSVLKKINGRLIK